MPVAVVTKCPLWREELKGQSHPEYFEVANNKALGGMPHAKFPNLCPRRKARICAR
jgi:hypothetical protein